MRPALRVISRSPLAGREGQTPDRDGALARRVSLGDQAAVAELAKRCLPVVYAIARRLLRDTSEAEDMAQETFVKVWRAIDRFDPERARLETWVGRIATNTCYDRLRRRGDTLIDDAMAEREDQAPRAEAALVAAASAAEVRQAMEALPARQGLALELCAIAGHTNIEAAHMLDVSVEALESLLARARRNLKAALADQKADLLEGFSQGYGGET